MQAIGDGNI